MLTFERANELFRYDPISGKVFRKVTTSSRSIKGTEAGSLDKRERYLRVTVDGVGYQLHRVIMLLVHGHLDKSVQVDHISHDRADNRLCNLRLVSLSENNKNKSMDRRNSTGVTGVKFNKRYNTWGAHIGVSGIEIHLGSFKTLEEAAAARADAEIKYGFHPNHGL